MSSYREYFEWVARGHARQLQAEAAARQERAAGYAERRLAAQPEFSLLDAEVDAAFAAGDYRAQLALNVRIDALLASLV